MDVCIHTHTHIYTHCYHLVDLAHELSATHCLKLHNLPILQKQVYSMLQARLMCTFLELTIVGMDLFKFKFL